MESKKKRRTTDEAGGGRAMTTLSLDEMHLILPRDVIITHIKGFVIFAPKTIAELNAALEDRSRYGDITMWDFAKMYEEYKAKQSNLNALGVTDLVLVAIATHRAGIEGNMADEALEVRLPEA